MWDALSITEAEAAGLAELAALDLAMARDFAARAQGERDPDTANDLARSYQRMARSYRQSLALKVRLQREIVRAAHEAPPPAPPPPQPLSPAEQDRIDARVEELRACAGRVIWAEHERADPSELDADEAERCRYFFDLLEERLDLYAAEPGFGRQPLDEHVVSLCRAMGLDAGLARRWRDLPDPPRSAYADPDDDLGDDPEPDPEPPRLEWQGSG